MLLADWIFLAADLLLAITALTLLSRRLWRNYDPRNRLTTAGQALAGYGGEIVVLLALWQWQSGAALMSAVALVALWTLAHLVGMALLMLVMLAFVRV
jgi:hypothetical protein